MEAANLILGLIGLSIASDFTVSSARELAERLGVSTLLIGLTLTSIGTSIPELATNLAVAFSGRAGTEASGIAVGNVVGSNLSQITLLLGVVALTQPLNVPRRSLLRDGAMLVVAILLWLAVAWDGVVARWEGGILILVYCVYLAVLYREARQEHHAQEVASQDEEPAPPPRPAWQGLVRVLLGLIFLVFCANLVVGSAVILARQLGVSEMLIGLLVGLGTGLPELVVALRAIHTAPGLSLGTLLGSNISDPLVSFGAGAAVHRVTVEPLVLRFDLPFWLACTVIAIGLMATDRGISRREGVVMVVLFLLYATLRLWLTA